jgi:hypothetical protein
MASIPSGSISVFQQTAAPTNWTKITTYTNYTLRIVNSTASTGGTVAFTSAFATYPLTGTVAGVTGISAGGTTLTTAMMSAHRHTTHNVYQSPTYTTSNQPATNVPAPSLGPVAAYPGSSFGTPGVSGAMDVAGGGPHSHTFTASPSPVTASIGFGIAYVDVILASRN